MMIVHGGNLKRKSINRLHLFIYKIISGYAILPEILDSVSSRNGRETTKECTGREVTTSCL